MAVLIFVNIPEFCKILIFVLYALLVLSHKLPRVDWSGQRLAVSHLGRGQ